MQEDKNHADEIDLKELFSVLWHGKYFVISLTLISIAIGSFYLRQLSPKYEVTILLAPVQEEQTTNKLGNLGGLASLAGISLPTGSASDFAKYQIMLKTKEISTLIFKDKQLVQEIFMGEWDMKGKTFRKPKENGKTKIKKYIRELLTGQPAVAYIQPNPARLKAFINGNINISLDNTTQYLILSAENSNPNLLTKLMVSMIYNTDELFKEKFIKQSDDAITFYQIKMSKARSQEHRGILATLIAKEERKLLLATRDSPFVAEILTGPNTSLEPTSPNVTFTLTLSILIGLLISFMLLSIQHFFFKR